MPGVVVLDTLDAASVRLWSAGAVALLESHRDGIDALNVFPVPDGDTGTNMLATLRAAHRALADSFAGDTAPVDAVDALATLSGAAAFGAIGNSGFILSQILRGLAGAIPGPAGWDAVTLGAGLDAAARLGRAAVVRPVEGTILSVARAAADAAAEQVASGSPTLADVVLAAAVAADAALQRTPAQLPDLAEAGVVDAGGQGLVVLLDALVRTVTGLVPELTTIRAPLQRRLLPRGPREEHTSGAAERRSGERRSGEPGFGYEVQYLLEAPAGAVVDLRATLATLGDSVAVVAAGETGWKVHVHVADVGAAIEAGIEIGRPHRIEVVHLTGADHVAAGAAGRERGPTAVIAVAPGAGTAHLFETEGVAVVDSGDTAPTVEAVFDAIRVSRARSVVVLPTAAAARGVVEIAAARARALGIRVAVVPTRSPVQGLAAVAVHDAERRFDDDVVAMAEAAAATRFAEVTIARSTALTAVGICQPGDVLGLIDGEVVELGRGMLAVAFGLIDRLLGVGAELMTVLVGRDAPAGTGPLLEAHVRGRSPLTDVTVYQGAGAGQPVIIGVE